MSGDNGVHLPRLVVRRDTGETLVVVEILPSDWPGFVRVRIEGGKVLEVRVDQLRDE